MELPARRRAKHALTIAATVGMLTVALAGCGGSPSDTKVAHDLQSALYLRDLQQNADAPPPSMPTCSHQNGDAYICYEGQTGYSVTDDGHNISWQPSP